MADTTKLVRISEWFYDELKALAEDERRTIGAQNEQIYVEWKRMKKLLAELEPTQEAS